MPRPGPRRHQKRENWILFMGGMNTFIRCRALVASGALSCMESPPPTTVGTRQWNRDTYEWVNWLHRTAGDLTCYDTLMREC